MSSPRARGSRRGWVVALIVPLLVFGSAFALIVANRGASVPPPTGAPVPGQSQPAADGEGDSGDGDPTTEPEPTPTGVTVDTTDNPFLAGSLFVNPQSLAVDAAATAEPGSDDAAVLTRLAQTPTAIWLTPEKFPPNRVGPYVRQVVAQAAQQNTIPVFVVYGIPDRDCGSLSAGGLSEAQYPGWVREINAALERSNAVVIVEPDALPLAQQCGNLPARIAQVSDDVDALDAEGITVYLDAGHSDWLPADTMASILQSVGIDRVHGFATNISNYNSDQNEIDYAEQISGLLGGTHFIVDSGRNGNGSIGEWCNPSGRALGTEPSVAGTDTGQDAFLWIKPPGESDGTCNGGPAAGAWWQANALELAANAGWVG